MKFVEYNELKEREECVFDTEEANAKLKEHDEQFQTIANEFTTEQTDNLYKIKYGDKVIAEIPIGGTVEPIPTTYSITNNLTNCTNSNTATTIEENTSYSANISTNEGYRLKAITVTMGEIDITSDCYSNGRINIATVTGDIVITVETEVYIDTVVGSIDSNNDISLTGLSTGTYTLKYEDGNGNVLDSFDIVATMEVV